MKPPISPQSLPFHLTQALLTSWGYKFNESEINLSLLNIGSVEANLFSRFACLKKLTLRYNKMLRLYQDTFKNCVCLTFLDMSYNRLLQVKQGDFDGAVNLESIYLNNNQIEHISLSTFFNLSKIVDFNIGNNPVSVLYNLTLSNGMLTSTFIG